MGDKMQKGNSRLPGDLLGRWTRLVEGLETITQGRWEEGFHIDMSDLVVLNAFLTEDAEFAKWQGGTWNATPVADAEGVVWEPVRFDKTISDYEEVMAYYALQINRFNDLHEKPPMAICQRRPHAQQDSQHNSQEKSHGAQ